MKPIPDKVEIILEYPDKLYAGTFERSSEFDAHLDETGFALTLHHGGDESVRKTVHMHVHYALFAEILADLANSANIGPADESRRETLAKAANALAAALQLAKRPNASGEEMTASEEVGLLHIME